MQSLLVSLISTTLAVLFDRYERLVLSIALKIVRDPGETENATQAVFLDIYSSVAQFDPARGTTQMWFLQHAYDRAINRRKHLTSRHPWLPAKQRIRRLWQPWQITSITIVYG